MYKKCIFLLSTLTILSIDIPSVKSSTALSPAIPYGISQTEWREISKISTYEIKTIAAASESLNSLFQIIAQLGSNLIYDSGPNSHRTKALLTISYEKLLIVIKNAISSVAIAIDGSKSVLRSALNAITPTLKNVYFELIPQILVLIKLGDYPSNRADLEKLWLEISTNLSQLEISIYQSILEVLDTNDPDLISAINSAKLRSLDGLELTLNAISNSLKLLAIEFTTSDRNPLLVITIEQNRQIALIGATRNAQSLYSLLRALVIYNSCNNPGTAVIIGDIQLAISLGTTQFVLGTSILFDTIKTYLQAIYLGLECIDTRDNANEVIVQITITTKFNTALNAIFDVLLKILPSASGAIQTLRSATIKVVDFIIKLIFDIIALALQVRNEDPAVRPSSLSINVLGLVGLKIQGTGNENSGTQSAEIAAKVQLLETKIIAAAKKYVDLIFDGICALKKLPDNILAEIEILLHDTYDKLTAYLTEIKIGVEILIRASLARRATNADFTGLKNSETKAIGLISSVVVNLTDLLRIVFRIGVCID